MTISEALVELLEDDAARAVLLAMVYNGRAVVRRGQHFSEAIVAGAVAHLYRTGITPEQPHGMPRGRWMDMHLEEDPDR